jgi:hypothetical protein
VDVGLAASDGVQPDLLRPSPTLNVASGHLTRSLTSSRWRVSAERARASIATPTARSSPPLGTPRRYIRSKRWCSGRRSDARRSWLSWRTRQRALAQAVRLHGGADVSEESIMAWISASVIRLVPAVAEPAHLALGTVAQIHR